MTIAVHLFDADFPAVRDRYRNLLAEVANALRQGLGDNLLAIYLLGSAGRGAATLLQSARGWEIANDFDIAVVVRERLSCASLLALMEECTALVNPSSRFVRDGFSTPDFHVDVSQISETDLGVLGPTMFAVDFVYGGALLWGRDVRNRISFGPSDVPRIEAYLLLYNRLCSLIETVTSEHFDALQGVKSEPWLATAYISRKVIIDSGAAILIGSGRYSPDYQARAGSLRWIDAALAERYAWWCTEGASLATTAMDGQELRRMWLEAYELFLRARTMLGLMPLSLPDGRMCWRAVGPWLRAHVSGQRDMRRYRRDGKILRPFRIAAGISRGCRPMLRRLDTYRTTEGLAAAWYAALSSARGSEYDLTEWYQRRVFAIDAWKKSNWT